MADSIKEKQSISDASYVYYSFTDFSNNTQTRDSNSSSKNPFLGGVFNQDRIEPDGIEQSDSSEKDSEEVRRFAEEAFTKGLEQGRSETMIAQREKVDQVTTALKTAIEEFSHLRKQDVDRMETETVRLALSIAKKIIGKESSEADTITHVFKMAMQKVTDPRSLILRLNPEDIQTIRKLQEEWLVGSDMNGDFQIEADESILQGGCIIETKLGDVDARIDQQIKIIEEQLNAQLPRNITK